MSSDRTCHRTVAWSLAAAPLALALVLALILALALVACSPQRDDASLFAPDAIDEPVVDALLEVGRPLPEIRLSRTRPPDQPYVFSEAAIVGADVRVISAGDTIAYAERPVAPGVYWPERALVVAPEAEYSLLVDTDRGERITASTTTPPRLEVERWVLLSTQGDAVERELRRYEELGDGVYTAPENQIQYTVGVLEARLASEPAEGYQLAVASLDLDSDFVIDVPFLDDEDLAEIERSGSSPPVLLEDRAIQLPWFSIYFAGRHVWSVVALDRNAFDLIRTSPDQGGGGSFGGNAGDSFVRPLYRLEGAVGLFGSASRDSLGFTIWPAP